MENERTRASMPSSSSIPFSLLFAQVTVPVHTGDQTVGAKTETQTSLDGVVKTDSEEDEDVDEAACSGPKDHSYR